MTRRLTLATAAFLTASLVVGLPALAAKGKGKGPKVTFAKKSVSPKSVNGGAQLTVAVTIVASGGAVVSGASVRLVRSGASPTSTGMSSAGGGVYTKNVNAPGNFGKTPINLEVYVDAASSIGTVSTKVGTVKVGPTTTDGTTPPPPPDI